MWAEQYLMTEDGKEVLYWRKANSIHRYMTEVATNKDQIENDNRTDFYIARSDIENLRDICWELIALTTHFMNVENWEDCIIAKIKFSETAKKLLPTRKDFPFNSTEYDCRYLQDLFRTARKLDKILLEHNDSIFIYYAWYQL